MPGEEAAGVGLSSRSRRGSDKGVVGGAASKAAEAVHSYVRQRILEELRVAVKTGAAVSKATVEALTALDDAGDEELLVPVDLRERLDMGAAARAAEAQDAALAAKAYIRAAELFATNPEGALEADRPASMTAREWKAEEECEEDLEFEEGEEEEMLEGEDEEEEDAAGDDDDKDEVESGPWAQAHAAKRRRMA
mmetsp:Transcript_124769/g.399788  ORF Transcript_124769/g.399788 Transcript_124769/m.399788 type:complete len:194 (-) Transcript_124769:82-663(-)